MHILLLSRPVVNAGDYLFTARSLEAFENICPDADIQTGHISRAYELDYLNQFDAVVAAGGPLYDNRFLTEEAFPALRYAAKMLPKLHFLSNGWYGPDAEAGSLSNYRFEHNVKKKLNTIEKRGGTFSCRDFISEYILRNNGIRNVTMTGCTAWYDYDRLGMYEPICRGRVRRILLSDQGITKDPAVWEWKYKQVENTISLLKEIFPEAEFAFTFNGGIQTKYSEAYNLRICGLLRDNDIAFHDISGSMEGFSLCDAVDLHVGFRVHTHIHCMSRRIPSVLISEDARGIGCNTALGLHDIRDFSVDRGKIAANSRMIQELEYYLSDLMKSDFQLLTSAYVRMNTVYRNFFVPFVRRIGFYDKG